jgi:hypothetical protein
LFPRASRGIFPINSKSDGPSNVPSNDTGIPYPNPKENAPRSIWGRIGFPERDDQKEHLGEYALARVDDVMNMVTKNSLWYLL